MKLKCISHRLNYVAFDENGKPHRVREGDTFNVRAKSIPAKWHGLVVMVEDDSAKSAPKQAVTNPAKGGGVQAKA